MANQPPKRPPQTSSPHHHQRDDDDQRRFIARYAGAGRPPGRPRLYESGTPRTKPPITLPSFPWKDDGKP